MIDAKELAMGLLCGLVLGLGFGWPYLAWLLTP